MICLPSPHGRQNVPFSTAALRGYVSVINRTLVQLPILLVLLRHRKWLDFQYGWELKYLTEETKCSLLARARDSRLTAVELVFESEVSETAHPGVLPTSESWFKCRKDPFPVCPGYMLKAGHPKPGLIAWQSFFKSGLLTGNYLEKSLGNLGQTLNYWKKQFYCMYYFWLESGSPSIRLCTMAT